MRWDGKQQVGLAARLFQGWSLWLLPKMLCASPAEGPQSHSYSLLSPLTFCSVRWGWHGDVFSPASLTGRTCVYSFSLVKSEEIKPVNPKKDQPSTFIGRTDAETEAPIPWPPDAKSRLTGKDPDAGKDWRQEEKRGTEDEMVGWCHWLNGQMFEQNLGDSEGQESLACCSPWGLQRVRHNWATDQKLWREAGKNASHPFLGTGFQLSLTAWDTAF